MTQLQHLGNTASCTDSPHIADCSMDSNRYPRVTIQYCTQCKWLLRAAYFAQELLSTFSTSLGEVSLLPSIGGTFVVTIYHQDRSAAAGVLKTTTLWDRKVDGGFPETKILKQRVRDAIDPGRDLGHVDGKKSTVREGLDSPAAAFASQTTAEEKSPSPSSGQKSKPREVCEDCQ